MKRDRLKNADKAFKYKVTGGYFSSPQYFNHLNAISRRLDITNETLRKAIMTNNGLYKDYLIELNDNAIFNDFYEGDILKIDGIELEVLSVSYENVIIVRNKDLGTGVLNIKTMKLADELRFGVDEQTAKFRN